MKLKSERDERDEVDVGDGRRVGDWGLGIVDVTRGNQLGALIASPDWKLPTCHRLRLGNPQSLRQRQPFPHALFIASGG